ncbi:hypothetical protein FRC10_010136 [Ceratobasidium sp. 414]|nr:hypothetical protein FRC10_010136 [Ceratobasidium sp. 414]
MGICSRWLPVESTASGLDSLTLSTLLKLWRNESVSGSWRPTCSWFEPDIFDLGCIVVMTGKTDYVSDGYTAVALSNGHHMMGDVTGSGCIVGTAIAAFAAAARLEMPESKEDEGRLVRGDMFQAAVAGVLAVTIAAEIAAERPDVKGTGTFFSALIDELYNLKPEVIAARAMIEVL